MTSHLDDGTIHELLDGEIPSAQLPPLQAHLASCAECRARLDSARTLVDFGDELIELLDDPPVAAPVATVVTTLPTPSRPWIRQLAWAASIAVAVGAGWYVRGDVQRVLPPVPVDSPIADAISAVPPAVVTAPAAGPERTTASGTAPSTAAERPALLRDRQEVAAKTAAPGPEQNRLSPSVQKPAAEAPPLDLRSAQSAPPATPAPAIAGRATGGGLALGEIEARRIASTARGNRSDLAPRDQVATKQLLLDGAPSDTIAIRLVALQWLLDSSGVILGDARAVICVAVSASEGVGNGPINPSDRSDLPDSLRSRLVAGTHPLRGGSACSTSSVAPLPTVETATGNAATLILIGGVRLGADDRATVGMQQRQGGRSAGGFRCELERRNGGWVVVACRRTWVA
jgi:hypothetical protein